ncbi:hypothetical protein NP493_37g01012 [Ridgeia piscesae]|uniref:BPTI/Kunitz inhibitor domain-containing protein n=1 Tax=Ridgeia piscesae TaxID=27915 RepID=A0AAD9PCB2_RIDPI|nr:hypothetical protein NP493_37g01012 [Ridgeia piscesae]
MQVNAYCAVLVVMLMLTYSTVEIGAQPDACNEPYVTGKCRAMFPRYYYDVASGECKLFTYGGCDGNANNFEDKAACEKMCKEN